MRIELTGVSFTNPVPCPPVVVHESFGTYTVTFPRPIGAWIGETLAGAMGLLDHRKRRVRKKRASRAWREWRRVGTRRLGAHNWAWLRQSKADT